MTSIKGALCLTFAALLFAVGGPALTEQVQPVTMLPTPTEWSEMVETVFDQEAYEAEMVSQYWACVESGRCVKGWATYYGPEFTGRSMFSGKLFHHEDTTIAASDCYDIGTAIRLYSVKELETFNQRGPSPYAMAIEAVVLDRGGGLRCSEQWQSEGPIYDDGRPLVDLSLAAFELLSPRSRGSIPIAVEIIHNK